MALQLVLYLVFKVHQAKLNPAYLYTLSASLHFCRFLSVHPPPPRSSVFHTSVGRLGKACFALLYYASWYSRAVPVHPLIDGESSYNSPTVVIVSSKIICFAARKLVKTALWKTGHTCNCFFKIYNVLLRIAIYIVDSENWGKGGGDCAVFS